MSVSSPIPLPLATPQTMPELFQGRLRVVAADGPFVSPAATSNGSRVSNFDLERYLNPCNPSCSG